MLLRTCKSLDRVSEYLSDPLALSSLILAKNKKFLQGFSDDAKNVHKAILNIIKSSSESSLTHYRFSVDSNIFRLFALKDVAVAVTQEDEVGQVIKYGVEVLNILTNILESSVQLRVLVEEIPLEALNVDLVKLVKQCIEEAEKHHLTLWRKKGLYWFKVEELLSDRGSYMYVFRVRDVYGDIYALKVFKEEIAVGRDFIDLVRGYIQGFAVSKIDEKEIEDLVMLKGHPKEISKDLSAYRSYVSSVKALITLKDKLDENTYTLYPPAVVEEYASLGDLETYIQKNGVRNLEETMYVIIRISGATALAHLMNIVHLDIKPRNILLFNNPQEKYGYTPKLNDFSGAIGDPVHGFKLIRLTPAYADPLALAKGVSDFTYDVYSLAIVISYMLSGDVPKHRLILNIILLQNIYGYPIPMEKVREDEKPLKEFMKKALDMTLQLKSNVITWQEFAQKIDEELDPLDNIYMPWLNDTPKAIATVTKKALSLRSENRYKDCVDLWMNLKDALVKENMENIAPR